MTRGNASDMWNPSDWVLLFGLHPLIQKQYGKQPFLLDKQPESEVLVCSTSVILQVHEQIPHFHTRAMRYRFIQVFGLVTGVKPAVHRELYRQLTGNNSSAHDED